MLSNALAADRALIADLETRILDLERSLAALRLQKRVAQERLDSYKYLVLTLPVEITSEIFIQFLPTYPLCPPVTGPLSPTFLTHICREWRAIALATPALWRAVALAGDDISCHLISSILNRSGCYPLSIRMDYDEDEYGNVVCVPPGPKAFSAVLPYRARWEYLKLRLAGLHLPPIEGGMPLLRCLDLELDGDLHELLEFHGVPLLRAVTLDYNAARNVTLPWGQLTFVTLHEVASKECVPILQQATNLVYCQLDFCLSYCEDESLPDVTLPYLKSLCCNDILYNDPEAEYLDNFIVPSLRTLQITETLLRPDPIDSLASFISKSGCKLEEVRITGKRLVSGSSYREVFPSIRTFFFTGAFVGDGKEEREAEGDSDS
ncbi:F-box domain-containing protein [Mycena venus]|uniref:F-box domain-containing protein n=1 Tax=Mycena venus TaxID=2733690 RepID=A0A8H7CFW5_9AGAR|nr:F-box domain-containing protein [Mycena venus]